MRELGFSTLYWRNYEVDRPKLGIDRFTSFRFPRRDKDWAVGELVKIVYKARSPANRSVLGLAEIVKKEPRVFHIEGVRPELYHDIPEITEREAKLDGFLSRVDMEKWILAVNKRMEWEAINKLTLAWTQRWLYVAEQKAYVAKEWAEILKREDLPVYSSRNPQYIMTVEMLERVHNEAALGNITL